MALSQQQLFTVEEIPGKGKGLVANRLIIAGTRILCEEPIIQVPDSYMESPDLSQQIFRLVEVLPIIKQSQFMSLWNIYEYRSKTEQCIGIVRTNGLPTGAGRGGVFEYACRMNHACNNNAQKAWNENIQRHTVHALRDIAPGEEITVFYLHNLYPHKQRQQELQAKFRFTCGCDLCSLDLKESRESDVRLQAILTREKLIAAGGIQMIKASPLQMLRYVDEQVRLYEQHGPGDVGLARAFFYAAQILLAHGDLARGTVFAKRAANNWSRISGADSVEVIRHGKLHHDPSKCELYGISMDWKTSASDIPNSLDSNTFEDWLWKRKKAGTKTKRKKRSKQTERSAGGPTPIRADEHFVCQDTEPFNVTEIHGKGRGIVATRRIAKGARILAESPLFTLPVYTSNIHSLEADLRHHIRSLDQEKREQYYALHNIYEGKYSSALGIYRTNALPLGPDATEGGIFLRGSRINHSCRQNAQNTWNNQLNQITIHAIRNIEQGEEITISYLSASESYSVRQSYLKDGFGFTCTCSRCSMSPTERKQSDERLDSIMAIDKLIGDGISIISTPSSCLGSIRRLLNLLQEEGIDDANVPSAYYDAFQILIANGDQARASVFAQRASNAWKVLQGEDGPNTLLVSEYAERPSRHHFYGTTKRWKNAATKIPSDIDDTAFEDWLWRRTR